MIHRIAAKNNWWNSLVVCISLVSIFLLLQTIKMVWITEAIFAIKSEACSQSVSVLLEFPGCTRLQPSHLPTVAFHRFSDIPLSVCSNLTWPWQNSTRSVPSQYFPASPQKMLHCIPTAVVWHSVPLVPSVPPETPGVTVSREKLRACPTAHQPTSSSLPCSAPGP